MAARTMSLVEHLASGSSWLKQASWPGAAPQDAVRMASLANAHFAAATALATIANNPDGDNLAEIAKQVDDELERRAEATRRRREREDADLQGGRK